MILKILNLTRKRTLVKLEPGIGAEESLVVEKISRKKKSSTFHQGNRKHYLRIYMESSKLHLFMFNGAKVKDFDLRRQPQDTILQNGFLSN